MSDISAVVLTIGEEVTNRAIESLKHQTVLPAEIIVIENVVPFHKALNLGASKVKTEFFIQVDSDMILDANCLEGLRQCMAEDVGVVVGLLRDDLIGRIQCVKMFRTECFKRAGFKDSISPDTDFADEILKYNFKTVYAVKYGGSYKEWHTFGEHKPAYNKSYIYLSYLLKGKRYRYRRSLNGLLWHFKQLEKSAHPMSLIAQVAIAHGIFLKEDIDLLRPFSEDRDFDFLEKFMKSEGCYKNVGKLNILLFFTFKPRTVFRRYYKLGTTLRKHNSFSTFLSCLNDINKSYDAFAWIAKAALCHGIFLKDYNEENFNNDYDLLKEFYSRYKTLFIIKKKIKSLLGCLIKHGH